MVRGDRGVRGADLRRLRYFVAVAEELHFGRAAARLHMSAPPLSQRIRELEHQLGLALFERTSRRVALTPAGERLLVDARDVLRAVERFDAAAAELASAPTTWTVGYCHGSEDGMMRTIRAFHAEHPDVVVRPDGLTSLLILDGLRTGRIAAGIVRGPVAEPSRVASVLLARVPVDHVAVPPDHRLACSAHGPAVARPVPSAQGSGGIVEGLDRHPGPDAVGGGGEVVGLPPGDDVVADEDVVQASELDGEPVLVVERADAPTAHDEIESYCTAMGARPHWVNHAAVQVERVLDLVALGTGIGWLNAWQAQRARGRDDIVVRRLHPVELYDEFRVAWRAGDSSTVAAAFVRVALETCAA
ncbi:MAG: LysR family transcriptional regulator [Acidimicrobiales bacterium]